MAHRRPRSARFHTLPLTLTTLAVLLDPLAAPPAAVAQASDQQLFVSVVDRKGLPITDLAPEEISVQEDGGSVSGRH